MATLSPVSDTLVVAATGTKPICKFDVAPFTVSATVSCTPLPPATETSSTFGPFARAKTCPASVDPASCRLISMIVACKRLLDFGFTETASCVVTLFNVTCSVDTLP